MAGTNADVTNDHIMGKHLQRRPLLSRPVSDRDAVTRGGLTGDGKIGVAHHEGVLLQRDRSTDPEDAGARPLSVYAGAKRSIACFGRGGDEDHPPAASAFGSRTESLSRRKGTLLPVRKLRNDAEEPA